MTEQGGRDEQKRAENALNLSKRSRATRRMSARDDGERPPVPIGWQVFYKQQ